jgi:hypothetical protein
MTKVIRNPQKQSAQTRNGISNTLILTIVLLLLVLSGNGRIYKVAKGSDFPMISLFVKSLACTSLTSNVPTGFSSKSLTQNVYYGHSFVI